MHFIVIDLVYLLIQCISDLFSFLYHWQYFNRTWLYIWVARRVFYKKQKLFNLRMHTCSPPFFVGSVLLIFLVLVLWWVCTFWVPCCDVRYDFHIKTMMGSSVPPVGCRRGNFVFTLFVFDCYSNVCDGRWQTCIDNIWSTKLKTLNINI